MSGTHTSITKDLWLCDSAASIHITNDRTLFTIFNERSITVGTCSADAELKIKGSGTIVVIVHTISSDTCELELSSVAYAPASRCNLLSVLALVTKANLTFLGNKEGITFFDASGDEFMHAPLHHGLYRVKASKPPPSSRGSTTPLMAAAVVDFDHPVWREHRRLGHMSLDAMQKMLKMSTGLNLTNAQIKEKIRDVCPICATTRALYKIL